MGQAINIQFVDMKESGKSPAEIYRAARASGYTDIAITELLQELFDTRHIDLKEIIEEAYAPWYLEKYQKCKEAALGALPLRITMQVFADDEPVQGILIIVTLKSVQHSMETKGTNSEGYVTLTREDILPWAYEDEDYLGHISNYEQFIGLSGEIEICPLNLSFIEAASHVHEFFKHLYKKEERKRKIERLTTAKQALERLGDKLLSVRMVEADERFTYKLKSARVMEDYSRCKRRQK